MGKINKVYGEIKENREKITRIIFVIILLLLVFYVFKNNKTDSSVIYTEDGDAVIDIQERIEPGKFLNKETIIVLFYLLLVFIFRKNLNVANPNIKTVGRVSLMILSAYMSYLSFKSLKLPDFIAIIGGGGFVIGVVEASTNWKKYRKFSNKKGKRDRIVWVYLLITIIATLLDISMSAINFVTIEGRSIVAQKMFNEKRQIEQARADEKALDFFKSLTESRNFQNARFHAELYFSKKDTVKADSTKSNEQYSGVISSGFTNLLGSPKAGKIATNVFILLVSCGITLLMIAFSEADELTFQNQKRNWLSSEPQQDQEGGATKAQVFASNVELKDAIIAQLERQEKTGHVNKSAIARQLKNIYGQCTRQYVSAIDKDRKQRRIGFAVERDKSDN